MKLHFLGTGNAGVLNCYNTCFVIENSGGYLLVDGGGGNQILNQLKNADIDINNIHNIFLSHNHTDHILGIIWVIRTICQKMKFENTYQGNLNIYASDESIKGLELLLDLLFPMVNQFKDRVLFNIVEDGQNLNIIHADFKFFDIHAKKDKQFGFIVNNQLIFCGDEPLQESIFKLSYDKEYMIHESFCLDNEKTKYAPHQKGHCTVKEASIMAEKLNIKNLIIVHTKDNDLNNRKRFYTTEAKEYFSGNIFVPNDLEIIDII